MHTDSNVQTAMIVGIRATPIVMFLTAMMTGCGNTVLWRHAGHTIIRDETRDGFQLVQQYGPADKSAEWGPMETIVRRIDGRTGKVLSENRSWGRPNPQPDIVFGWNGEFVLYDHDSATFVRSANVLAGGTFVNPTDAALEVATLNAAQSVGARQKVTLPGGRAWTSDGWRGATVGLLRCYPSPLVGPAAADQVFRLYAVDLQNMVARPIEIPQAAEEVAMRDDLIIVRGDNSLTAYSLDGKRMWQDSTVSNERLSLDDSSFFDGYSARLRLQSPLIATMIGSRTSTNSTIVVRRADNGRVEWRKNLETVTPSVAMTLGPYVVFLGKREYKRIVQGQQSNDYETRWWVWDQAGSEIAKGIEPTWKAEYAFRGGAAATRVNVAFDSQRSTILVGAGLDSVLIRDAKHVRRLTDIPGEPLILNDGVLVCRAESSHFAIRLNSASGE